MFCHLSLSRTAPPPLHSFIVTVLVRPVRINHQSPRSSSAPFPPPLRSSYLPPPHASHSPSIYYRQSLFRVDPLSTMGTKQMCVSNPDGVIPMLSRDRGRDDSSSGEWEGTRKEKRAIGGRGIPAMCRSMETDGTG